MPQIHIEKTDKVTHSRTITLENLIELFKDSQGAPETATVMFNYPITERQRKIEIVWTEPNDPKKTLEMKTETTYGCAAFEEWAKPPVVPAPSVTRPVATDEVQVGDLVMVRDTEDQYWFGPRLLRAIEYKGTFKYSMATGSSIIERWRFARHLTDDERAQIKQI